MTLVLLPRRFSLTGMRFCDAYWMMLRTVVVLPVKEFFAMRGR